MSGLTIPIHPCTHNPTEAWDQIRPSQRVIKLNVKTPTTPQNDNMLRFVCMSDTHCLTSHLQFEIPEGDVFVHAGDFTRCGSAAEIEEFNSWIGSLPHKHKVVIAGNHELSFDPKFTNGPTARQHHKNAHTGGGLINEIPDLGMEREKLKAAVEEENTSDLITNAMYLQDEPYTICGIKLYGTPWQPEFCNWAFNLPRGKLCLDKWDAIPVETDVLITHTPPIGHGDLCCTGVRAGCVELLSTVQTRVKPKYHVFGHIHEGYGVTTDGKIIFINASTCNINYVPVNPPIVFDIPIPPGFSK
ncbi:metallophosphoesterase MPPED2 [Procambarus clarkii]|uniref:metallophosphoesterase MPPED2 n=1 Tax=Procambarus clarkii TaxID=6728 RepID=UPI001E67393C|nr:metallophosphoesterase MPPED2-like [Procambarus clarkii]XP_045585342.1 metallophosphoesterase MPPED2-like [Procambarus clarkii]XP_045585343.1 metallophosphoesterase MPPED2-like [Procambarus clarkii]